MAIERLAYDYDEPASFAFDRRCSLTDVFTKAAAHVVPIPRAAEGDSIVAFQIVIEQAVPSKSNPFGDGRAWVRRVGIDSQMIGCAAGWISEEA